VPISRRESEWENQVVHVSPQALEGYESPILKKKQTVRNGRESESPIPNDLELDKIGDEFSLSGNLGLEEEDDQLSLKEIQDALDPDRYKKSQENF
jgi:hypothetical protein